MRLRTKLPNFPVSTEINSRTVPLIFKSLRNRIDKILKPDPEFTRRMLYRSEVMWGYPGGSNQDLPILEAEDSWEKWKARPHWQRLLKNKSNSREFAKKLGCKVPDLYWRGNDLASIDFDDLPQNYVIRPTIGKSCNSVFLMRGNYNLFDSRTYTNEEIVTSLSEISIKNPRVEFLIEEFLASETGEIKIQEDYKFFMFNGEVGFIGYINRRGRHEGSNRFYDENWNPLPAMINLTYSEAPLKSPPSCLPEMVNCAKILSKAAEIFIRVDFYATRKGPVFGEFALTPSHGKGFSKAGRQLLMEKWEENCQGMI